MLAVQVASYYYIDFQVGDNITSGGPVIQLIDCISTLNEMERGGIFKNLGISNFLEGDFFGWYLEAWDDDVYKGIRRIISELANYSLVTLDADPDQTRDLLKNSTRTLCLNSFAMTLVSIIRPTG